MKEAKVSIVLPAYNAEKYISKTIKSILLQSHSNFELIILNDGSSDSTESIILSFKDSRIIYIKNITNMGLIKTLNKGFKAACGDYIARIDADDIAHPERLKLQVKFLESLGKPAVVGSNVIIIDNKDKIIKIPRNVHLGDTENFWIKFRKNPLHHPTVMMSKEIAFQYEEFYHSKDLHMEDYAAWLRINEYFPIYNLNQALLFYRVHESNVTKLFNVAQINGMIEVLISYHKKILNVTINTNTLKTLLFLKLEPGLEATSIFTNILTDARSFVEKFGNKKFVCNDVAYTLFNIGIKSGISQTNSSVRFIIQNLGFYPLIYALKLTLQEALRAFFLKHFYQLKYSRILKETL